jgi:hypothetical protein
MAASRKSFGDTNGILQYGQSSCRNHAAIVVKLVDTGSSRQQGAPFFVFGQTNTANAFMLILFHGNDAIITNQGLFEKVTQPNQYCDQNCQEGGGEEEKETPAKKFSGLSGGEDGNKYT